MRCSEVTEEGPDVVADQYVDLTRGRGQSKIKRRCEVSDAFEVPVAYFLVVEVFKTIENVVDLIYREFQHGYTVHPPGSNSQREAFAAYHRLSSKDRASGFHGPSRDRRVTQPSGCPPKRIR